MNLFWSGHYPVYDLSVGLLSNVVAAALIAVAIWAFPRLFRAVLRKVNWKLSGDLWWLACDLHSIKLQAGLGRIPEMQRAMKKALEHARKLGMKETVLTMLRTLLHDYSDRSDLSEKERTFVIREKVDRIIDYIGNLAEIGQPDYQS